MNGHTPGPWKWWTSNSWKRLRADEGRGVTRSVLEPYTCRDGHADCVITEDDMNLIAAAPDLLDSAKAFDACHLVIAEAIRRYDPEDIGLQTRILAALRANREAIEKAETIKMEST